LSGAPDVLYPPLVIEHSRRPHNCRELPGATHRATGANPLCGDHLELSARIVGGRVLELAFRGEGCAIARASASMLTDALRDGDTTQGRRLLHAFERLLAGAGEADRTEAAALGDLAVFAAVRAHPARKPCALLAWDAWRSILHAAEAAPETAEAANNDRHLKETTTP
jgi:nitrogen fixation NifU-like protein